MIFSGSKTRPETQKSEAQSYLDLCSDNDFWSILDGREESVKERIVLEEQALDSCANLVFSLVRFWKITGRWPEKISIISHEFKKERFIELHVTAMRWPVERVQFVGIDPAYMRTESEDYDARRTQEVRDGERKWGFGSWECDLWGIGESLRGKRRARNCWRVGQELFRTEEERTRSGVKSNLVEYKDEKMEIAMEEVLLDERQPWED